MESSSFLFQNVSVTEPQTHQDSMQVNSWVSYKVNCNSGNVTRRYSDFVWLSEVLNLSVPGCIIPSLPPKQTFGSLVNEFIQSRRRGLEKFLHRIVEHPELCISQYFKAFMEADETSFRQIMQNAQGLKPKR